MRSVCLRLCGAVLSIAAVTPLAASDAPEITRSYAQWYALAAEAYNRNDFVTMRDAVDGALSLRPDFPPMLYYRALASSKINDNDAAFAGLERLALLNTSPADLNDESFANIANDPRYPVLRHRHTKISTRPVGRAVLAYKLSAADFLPEGIAMDPRSNALYLGSVRKAHILRIVPPGAIDQTLISPDLGAVFGMRIDTDRDYLWVATGVVPELEEKRRPESPRATIMKYNVAGRVHLAGRYEFAEPGEHLFGDLIVTTDGRIITTDSIGGGVYRLDPDTREFETLVEPGVLYSPQGLAMSGNNILYVADYRRGLYRFDLARDRHQRFTTLSDASLYGIDGLYLHGDSLVAIQNGIKPHRVVQIPLDDNGAPQSPVSVLAMNLDGMDEPTLGSIAGDTFYFVANSQWHRFADPDNPPDTRDLTGPRIMRVDLD